MGSANSSLDRPGQLPVRWAAVQPSRDPLGIATWRSPLCHWESAWGRRLGKTPVCDWEGLAPQLILRSYSGGLLPIFARNHARWVYEWCPGHHFRDLAFGSLDHVRRSEKIDIQSWVLIRPFVTESQTRNKSVRRKNVPISSF